MKNSTGVEKHKVESDQDPEAAPPTEQRQGFTPSCLQPPTEKLLITFNFVFFYTRAIFPAFYTMLKCSEI